MTVCVDKWITAPTSFVISLKSLTVSTPPSYQRRWQTERLSHRSVLWYRKWSLGYPQIQWNLLPGTALVTHYLVQLLSDSRQSFEYQVEIGRWSGALAYRRGLLGTSTSNLKRAFQCMVMTSRYSMDTDSCRAIHIMKSEMNTMCEYVQRVGPQGLPPLGGWEHLRKYDPKTQSWNPDLRLSLRYVCFCESTMLFHTTTTLFYVVICLSALARMFFSVCLIRPRCSFPWYHDALFRGNFSALRHDDLSCTW